VPLLVTLCVLTMWQEGALVTCVCACVRACVCVWGRVRVCAHAWVCVSCYIGRLSHFRSSCLVNCTPVSGRNTLV